MAAPISDYRPLPPKTQLPPNKCLQKRPLLHPPINAPGYTSKTPIIYISASTPFISAVKRIENLLGCNPKSDGKVGGGVKEVTLKATGRAIDRALQIGCYFMERDSEKIVVKTGTVDVVDDIVEKVDWEEDGSVEVAENQKKREGVKKRKRKRGKKEEGPGDVEMGDGAEDKVEVEVFMKTRKTSMVEIIISSSTDS